MTVVRNESGDQGYCRANAWLAARTLGFHAAALGLCWGTLPVMHLQAQTPTSFSNSYHAQVQRFILLEHPPGESVRAPRHWTAADSARPRSTHAKDGALLGGIVGAVTGFVLLREFSEGESVSIYKVIPAVSALALLGAFLGAAIGS